MGDETNAYGYAHQNPLFFSDPQGLAVCAGACVTGAVIGAGRLIQIGVRAYRALQSTRALQGIVDGLNDRTGDKATFPWPPKKSGKYVCICRANSLNRAEGCSPTFGYGFGIVNDPQTARNIAEDMAQANLKGGDQHHTQCKCIDPKGQRI